MKYDPFTDWEHLWRDWANVGFSREKQIKRKVGLQSYFKPKYTRIYANTLNDLSL